MCKQNLFLRLKEIRSIDPEGFCWLLRPQPAGQKPYHMLWFPMPETIS
jgi:hypothetical protein